MVTESQKLTPPDLFHFSAALGWLDLGNPSEAAVELQRVSQENSIHPDVLEVRWQICARLEWWDVSLPIAEKICALAPDRPQGWLHKAVSLYRLKRTDEAWDFLRPKADQFPKSWVIPYDLACYACQLDRVEEARGWLRRAFKLGRREEVKRIALADPDLEVLWAEIKQGIYE